MEERKGCCETSPEVTWTEGLNQTEAIQLVANDPRVVAAMNILKQHLVGCSPEFTRPGTSLVLDPHLEILLKGHWKTFAEKLIVSKMMYGVCIVALVEDEFLKYVPVVY